MFIICDSDIGVYAIGETLETAIEEYENESGKYFDLLSCDVFKGKQVEVVETKSYEVKE